MYVPRRYVISFLCFLSILLTYFLRLILPVTILVLEEEFHWGSTTKGNVLSSFFWGYIVLQIPSAILSTRYGGGPILFVGMIIPAIFAFLSVPIAKYPIALISFQVVIGLGLSLTIPSIYAILSVWIPNKDMSSIIGYVWTGIPLGNAFGVLLAGIITDHLGWQSVFYIYGALTVLWCILWLIFGSSSPDNYKSISQEEIEYIRCVQNIDIRNSETQKQSKSEYQMVVPSDSNQLDISTDHTDEAINQISDISEGESQVSTMKAVNDNNQVDVSKCGQGKLEDDSERNIINKPQFNSHEILVEFIGDGHDSNVTTKKLANQKDILHQLMSFPWKASFTNIHVIAIYIAHISTAWIIYSFGTLLPKYMKFKLNTSVQKSSEFSFYPYICHGVVNFTAGYISGIFIGRGVRTVVVRKWFHAIGSIGTIIFLILCVNVSTLGLFITFISLGLSSTANLSTGFMPNYRDISPKYGSFILSVSNTIATVSGILSPIVAAAIIGENETDKAWSIIFYLGCGIVFCGGIFFGLFGKGTPVDSLN